jgi:hypothetical protein
MGEKTGNRQKIWDFFKKCLHLSQNIDMIRLDRRRQNLLEAKSVDKEGMQEI